MRESGSHIASYIEICDTGLVANESAFIGHTPLCLCLFARVITKIKGPCVRALSNTNSFAKLHH
jgi:hypothetical protein